MVIGLQKLDISERVEDHSGENEDAGLKSKSSYATCLEAYGVRISVEANSFKLLNQALAIVDKALADRYEIFDINACAACSAFTLVESNEGLLTLFQDRVLIAEMRPRMRFFKLFDSLLRLAIAENADSYVFLHAGVVGWKGKAILIPANSFAGKSTLTAALVRLGADYYSDDFAVLDSNAYVHPFPKMLTLRREAEFLVEDWVSAEGIGGKSAETAIAVGYVLFTRFETGATWDPKVLTPGEAVIAMIPHTIPIRRRPKQSFEVLSKLSRGAMMFRSSRGEALEFAKVFLDFIDNCI